MKTSFEKQPMIWGKRAFSDGDYEPHMHRLAMLKGEYITLRELFIMVSTKTDDPEVSVYYIGVRYEELLADFLGFERIDESDLPKVVDDVFVAEIYDTEFTNGFQWRNAPPAAPPPPPPWDF